MTQFELENIMGQMILEGHEILEGDDHIVSLDPSNWQCIVYLYNGEILRVGYVMSSVRMLIFKNTTLEWEVYELDLEAGDFVMSQKTCTEFLMRYLDGKVG